MKYIPHHVEALQYLKILKRVTAGKANRPVETEYVQKELGSRENGWANILLMIKSFNLIKEDEQNSGTISITAEGLRYVRRSNWFWQYLRKVEAWFEKYVKPFLEANRSTIVGFCFLFLLYLVIENVLVKLLNEYWVDPIVEPFNPGTGFRIVFICLAAYLVYINRKKPFQAWDLFLLVVYGKYRLFDQIWYFKPMIKMGKFEFAYTDIIFLYYSVLLTVMFYSKLKRQKFDFPDGYLYPDLPLNDQVKKRGLTIAELDKEGLERSKYAEQISTVVSLMKPFKAFSIGISGPWGSGKSSLLALVEANLKELRNAEKYTILWFSPWLFKDSEMLIANFFSLLEKNFKYNKGLANQLKNYGKEIALLEKSILKTEFSSVLFEENVSLKERYDAIKEQIQEEDRILVINIDDLDRLAKKEIVQVFRLIRIIADFPNTFYLVAYDRSYVTAAIKEVLTKYEPERYLDKVFNVEFKIPEVSSTVIVDRLRKTIDERKKKLADRVGEIKNEEYEPCFKYKDITKFIKNERDIIRFTNNLMMRYILIKGEVNFHQFFLLELINYHSPQIISEVFENKDFILNNFYSADGINWAKVLKDHQADDETIAVLKELFSVGQPSFGIGTPLYFTRYFSLGLLRTEFSNEEFETAVNSTPQKLKEKLIQFNSSNSTLLQEKLDHIDHFFTSTKKEDLARLTEALLFFYKEVFVIRPVNSTTPEVTTASLQRLIFAFAKKTGTIDEQAAFLSDAVQRFDKGFFAAFSTLFSPEAAYDYVSIPHEQLKIRTAFRNLNYLFLEELLTENNQTFDTEILRQLQEVHRFVGMQLISSTEDETWFVENVLKKYHKFFFDHMEDIVEYIDVNFVKTNKVKEVPEFVKQRFHKPEELYPFANNHHRLDDLVEYSRGNILKNEFIAIGLNDFQNNGKELLIFKNAVPISNLVVRIKLDYAGKLNPWSITLLVGMTENISDYLLQPDISPIADISSGDKENVLKLVMKGSVETRLITTPRSGCTISLQKVDEKQVSYQIADNGNTLYTGQWMSERGFNFLIIACDLEATSVVKRIASYESSLNLAGVK